MIYKDGVYIEAVKIIKGKPVRIPFSVQIKKAINLADAVSKGINSKEIVITSGLDGKHGAKSLHYTGNAFDIRTWIYTEAEIEQLMKDIKELLGKDYDVVLESDHIHIEYDPK